MYLPAAQVKQAIPLTYNMVPANLKTCAGDALIDIITDSVWNTTSTGFGTVLNNHITTS